MTILKLRAMMFLQFFVWGAWYVTVGLYLSKATGEDGSRLFSDQFIGDVYGTDAIAAMIAPFIVGMIADRFFASEYVLAFLHFCGGLFLFLAGSTVDPALFYLALLAHFLCYMPTIAISTSIALQNLDDSEAQFPGVRVLGTIGWIVAGVIVSALSIDATAKPLLLAGGAQILLAGFCLALPHTPPPAKGQPVSAKEVLGLEALSLMRNPSVFVFILASMLICIPLKFYYAFTGVFLGEVGISNVAFFMSFGQMSEIGFMLLLPLAFRRLGMKNILLIGMLCWVARYLLFAFGDTGAATALLFAGVLLHGVCYDFFFVAGQIYMDAKAPEARRSSAQGFLTFATLGVGMFIGSVISGRIVDAYVDPQNESLHDWTSIWLYPAGLAAAVTVMFFFAFKDSVDESVDEDVELISPVLPGGEDFSPDPA